MATRVFHDGQIVLLDDGRLGQINRAVFMHGQWRYCIATHRDTPFIWEWEGHLRGEHSAIYGRP